MEATPITEFGLFCARIAGARWAATARAAPAAAVLFRKLLLPFAFAAFMRFSSV
jgi:hypothetical protein